MWDVPDNQEVGLEAAILERVRNSSLVKKSRADNVTGLSHVPKLRQHTTQAKAGVLGRGASISQPSGGVTQPWSGIE
jgi:hypothetical protein